MSNQINDQRLEDLQAELNGKEVYYDTEVGYYTVTIKTVSDEELAEEFTTDVFINVLGDEYQNTMNLIRNIEVRSAGDWKEDLATFTIREN